YSHLIGHNPRLHFAYAFFISMACTVFCLWMFYAAGLDLILQGIIFFALGLPLYRRQQVH
ncbi:MAG: hypothetical protein K2L81_04615, partial [Muribaculaceae bacterium]|nr:hypothetical protein [Muribaculaceae bacterium]